MVLFKSRSIKLHGKPNSAMNLELSEKNYVLLLHRVRLSGRLGLSSLGIFAKSTDKSTLGEQDKGSR